MSLRDVTIAWDGKRGLVSANEVTHQKRAEDFGNLKKVNRVETRHWTRRLVFACSRGPLWGGRWKYQHRKIVPLSPYVEKPLNSKVIKSFVPEQRSRKCFSCFEIPMFYLYGYSMYVSHIAISWLWYMTNQIMFFKDYCQAPLSEYKPNMYVSATKGLSNFKKVGKWIK